MSVICFSNYTVHTNSKMQAEGGAEKKEQREISCWVHFVLVLNKHALSVLKPHALGLFSDPRTSGNWDSFTGSYTLCAVDSVLSLDATAGLCSFWRLQPVCYPPPPKAFRWVTVEDGDCAFFLFLMELSFVMLPSTTVDANRTHLTGLPLERVARAPCTAVVFVHAALQPCFNLFCCLFCHFSLFCRDILLKIHSCAVLLEHNVCYRSCDVE